MITTSTPDIRTEADIKTLINSFCQKANGDELLAPLFSAVAQIHWPNHLTGMYDFWSSVLLGTNRHAGEPIPRHLALPASGPHSQRWISLFFKAVEDNFTGLKAEEAKKKAKSIAAQIQQNTLR
ncbi:group III truncated hemoglobin [Hymenobacter jejuensis]|uniref:Group III truncated hemoglobin n=1 Tax=Hymenobacter jejuensis TaxID=2502781 RepID=A0A5B8A498_9BACT|nr:group III truncated hemoglobin [Hymenobacter jejuensis]QDA61435.1 group III truncated hemoglobin [Hymenobacter jejuensis]